MRRYTIGARHREGISVRSTGEIRARGIQRGSIIPPASGGRGGGGEGMRRSPILYLDASHFVLSRGMINNKNHRVPRDRGVIIVATISDISIGCMNCKKSHRALGRLKIVESVLRRICFNFKIDLHQDPQIQQLDTVYESNSITEEVKFDDFLTDFS